MFDGATLFQVCLMGVLLCLRSERIQSQHPEGLPLFERTLMALGLLLMVLPLMQIMLYYVTLL